MPTIRNEGKTTALIGEIEIAPYQTKECPYYPNPEDTHLVVVSDNPVWKFGQVAEAIEVPALAGTSTLITIPYNTVNIAIENGSESLLKVYNGSKDIVGNFPLKMLKGSVKIIEYTKNRCKTIQLEGTSNVGEIIISFLGIN